MADTSTSTNINFTKAESTISEWNQAALSFSSSVQKASSNSCIQDLSSAGLESGFANSYDQRFEDLAANIKTLTSELSSVIKEFYEVDVNTPTPTDPRTTGTDKTPRTTSTDTTRSTPTPKETPTPTPTTTPTPTPTDTQKDHDKLYAEMAKEFSNLSMEGLDGLASELVKYAESNKISVEELLSNSDYATKLHSLLLQSSYLTDDMKKLITDSGAAITQELLRNIFNGKQTDVVGLNDDTASIYLAYLQSVAASKNVKIEELLTDAKYNDVVKTTLEEFGKISGIFNGMSDEEIVKRALEIYDGNNVDKIDEETLKILRAYMEVEASERNKDVQELTKEDAHLFKDLSKFGSMSKTYSGSSQERVQDTIINVLNAKSDEVKKTNTETTTKTSSITTKSSSTQSAVTRELTPEEEIDVNYGASEDTPYTETYDDSSTSYDSTVVDTSSTQSTYVDTSSYDTGSNVTTSSIIPDSNIDYNQNVDTSSQDINVDTQSVIDTPVEDNIDISVQDQIDSYDDTIDSVPSDSITSSIYDNSDSNSDDTIEEVQDDSVISSLYEEPTDQNDDDSVISSLYDDSSTDDDQTSSQDGSDDFESMLDAITM